MKNTLKTCKKYIFSLTTALIMFCSVVSVSACDDGVESGGNPDEKIYKDSPSVSVWTTSALAKVTQDGKFADTLCEYEEGDSVSIEMAKNEYESAQIIISATDDVQSYFVEATDLSDGKGNTLPKTAIELYHQEYVPIEQKTVNSSPYQLGMYPDALVPMEKAVEYKENTVEAGKNQGIWLTVKTEHETVPSTYNGEISVKVNKDTYSVPIRVKVWDIDVSDDFHCPYISGYSTNMAFINEGDASQERMDKLNEFLLDYRVINEIIATECADVETFVNNLAQHKD